MLSSTAQHIKSTELKSLHTPRQRVSAQNFMIIFSQCPIYFVNSAGKTKYLYFFVVPPNITSERRSEVVVEERNMLFLECKAEGVPTPRVIWKKDGLVIQNQTKSHTYFNVKKATKADEGVYVCEAFNSAGNDTYTVEVKIIPLEGMDYR